MGAVALDASVIIAFLSSEDAQNRRAVDMLAPALAANRDLLIPASVYAEILVRPIQLGLVDTVDRFLLDARIEIVATDRAIARRAAALRASYPSLRLPDALALATALDRRAEFLTLDDRLRRVAEEISEESG